MKCQNEYMTTGTKLKVRYEYLSLSILLIIHGSLLLYCAKNDSPTFDEPMFIASSAEIYKSGTFDFYYVSPPLVKFMAGFPLLMMDLDLPEVKKGFIPGENPGIAFGREFVQLNEHNVMAIVFAARIPCCLISVFGAFVCFRFSRDLYGVSPALFTTACWCFSPTITGHGHLVSSDVPAAAFALNAAFYFSRMLRLPSWSNVLLSGLNLGLAVSCKSTLLILYPTWLLMMAIARFNGCFEKEKLSRLILIYGVITMLSLLISNSFYFFQGSFHQLKNYRFVSNTLSGNSNFNPRHNVGNRFSDSVVGQLPVPLPRRFVEGVDRQKKEFESFGKDSYLGGECRREGWWYYYLYAILVKLPCGYLVMMALSLFLTWLSPVPPDRKFMWWTLWGHFAVVLIVVSSNTGFNHHFRYIIPALPFLFTIFGAFWDYSKTTMLLSLASLASVIISSLAVFPHSLSYFNELAGGPENGFHHLAHSNIDWGQDLLYLKKWITDNPDKTPFYTFYDGVISPSQLGIKTDQSSRAASTGEKFLPDGFYAMSINKVVGCGINDPMDEYLKQGKWELIGRAGYSINIYRHSSR